MERETLTGIYDVDRLIVDKLDDRELLNLCSVNTVFTKKICNETYFRVRTENRFPETIEYKDAFEKRSWKKHYLSVVKYIDLLRQKNIVYEQRYKSPELLYKSVDDFSDINLSTSLVTASLKGDLTAAKYLIDIGADIDFGEGRPLASAVNRNNFNIVQFLVENGANVNIDSYIPLIAVGNGNLEILKYLVDNGIQIRDIPRLIHLSNKYRDYPMQKYLQSL